MPAHPSCRVTFNVAIELMPGFDRFDIMILVFNHHVMQISQLFKFTSIVTFAILLTFGACDSDKEVLSPQEELSLTQKSTQSEGLAEEEVQFVHEAAIVPNERGRLAETPCVTVTRDIEAKKITLDFGTGCEGLYGITRSGKVFMVFTGSFDDKTAQREITFENYKVNDAQIEGKIKVSGFSRNSEGFLTSTRELVDFKVTFKDGSSFTLNGSTTRELIEGEDDQIVNNEKIRVTGGHNGVSSTGRTFSRVIVEPIIASFACAAEGKFIRVQGTQEITVTNSVVAKTRTIDYGNGDCDNEISIIINGKSYTISISH